MRVILVVTAGGIANDGCLYLWLAKDIAAGDISKVATDLPPLFPVLTAGLSYIAGDFELAARCISCFFGALTVFPLFFLAKNIFDRKVAIVTVLFFIAHPYLTEASGAVLTGALYYFFVTSIACLTWIAIKKKRKLIFLLVGLLLFLAFLTRFEGIALTFLVLIWIWFTRLPDVTNRIRWKLASSVLCLIVFMTSFFPYLLVVHQKTGKWQVCPGQERYTRMVLEDLKKDQTPLEKIRNVLLSNFDVSIPRIPVVLARAYHPLFLPFLFFGTINRKRFEKHVIGEMFILSFILTRILMLLIFAGITRRYFYAFLPIALCWAGVGFCEMDSWFQGKPREKICFFKEIEFSRSALVILLVIVAIGLQRGLRPIRHHRVDQKQAGLWLRQNSELDNFSVVSMSPQESYYAGGKWHKLKGSTYSEMLNYTREKNADFLIVDKGVREVCPDFKALAKKEDMEVFTNEFEKSSRNIVIYELKK